MPHTRYQKNPDEQPLRALPAAALRAVFAEGYGREALRADILAGLVVGIVALPLAMALSVGVGLPPQHGLYTTIVAGLLVAALGGSRTQVTGPTAAFIVILAPVVLQYGLGGLLTAGAMAGAILIGLGLLRLGKLITFIPHPVTTGFTAGIATVIAVIELKDLLGLKLAKPPEHMFDRIEAMFDARASASLAELGIGLFTLGLLLLVPRITRRVPAPLLALPLAALLAYALGEWDAELRVATLASQFKTRIGEQWVAGVPRLPPLPLVPWHQPDASGAELQLSLTMLRALVPSAFAIALLGAIESLLSAVVADGMARTRHDPDSELLALGIGNLVTPFFGGIPATGAIARTATNVRFGARSPIAAIVHALTVLAAVVGLAPALGYLPISAMAGLLLIVAWNMSDAKHFVHIVRVAPRSDVAVLLCCYLLTVFFDMVVGVSAGVVLAALLFMQRMAAVTHATVREQSHPALRVPVPEGVLIYEISGPLFFGAAQKAMAALGALHSGVRVVVLLMERVNALDATGLVALESALDRISQAQRTAILCGVRQQPLQVLRKAGMLQRAEVRLVDTLEDAVDLARAALPPAAPAASRAPLSAPR